MSDTTDLTEAIDEWLAAGADSQPDADAVGATMQEMLARVLEQPDVFQQSIDKMRREIAILQIITQTGMSYDQAVDYLKRRGE